MAEQRLIGRIVNEPDFRIVQIDPGFMVRIDDEKHPAVGKQVYISHMVVHKDNLTIYVSGRVGFV